jgi:hypothetical protein
MYSCQQIPFDLFTNTGLAETHSPDTFPHFYFSFLRPLLHWTKPFFQRDVLFRNPGVSFGNQHQMILARINFYGFSYNRTIWGWTASQHDVIFSIAVAAIAWLAEQEQQANAEVDNFWMNNICGLTRFIRHGLPDKTAALITLFLKSSEMSSWRGLWHTTVYLYRKIT